jgi:glutamyl-tRNA synthetase
MEISHVIRGEEWLPSAPTHVLLYKAFGWEKTMPAFAHLPLLLKPVGDGKLSKRDGEAFGFPVFPLSWKDEEKKKEIPGFREKGYLPEALLNFLALLGWNPGTEQEIFSLRELTEAFSLERIGKSGTRFDIQKANWFNHHYLQEKPSSYFRKSLSEATGEALNDEKLELWVKLVKERCSFEEEMAAIISELSHFNGLTEAGLLREKWNEDSYSGLSNFLGKIQEIEDWTALAIKTGFTRIAEEAAFKAGKLFLPLRISMTGNAAGPDLMLFMELIGREECRKRLEKCLETYRELI